MRRCGDCAKWRAHRGYCPVYATRKGEAEKMCAWMRREQNLAYLREYARAKYHAKDFHSPTAGRAAMRKPQRQKTRHLCTGASGEPNGE